VIAVGVFVAAHTSKGIAYDTTQTLVSVVLILSLLNLVVKPLLVFFTLPFVVFTLGVGLWLINAGLLVLTSYIVPGFMVESFWAALWGSLVISSLSLLMHVLSHTSSRGCPTSCDCSDKQDCSGEPNCKDENAGPCSKGDRCCKNQ